MNDEILPLRKAFLWIFIFTLLVSGSSGAGLWVYRSFKRAAAADGKYTVTTLILKTDDQPPLDGSYFAEFLDLSADRPVHLTSYNIKNATRKLLASPCIKSATIERSLPNALSITYAKRKPVAELVEFPKTLVDDECIAIPSQPFFCEQKFPEIVLGDGGNQVFWGQPVSGGHMEFAMAVLKGVEADCNRVGFELKRVDVSRTQAASAGQRELLLVVEGFLASTGPMTYYLRLSTDHYEKDLQNFFRLQSYLCRHKEEISSSHVVVDLRVPQLAFLLAVH